VRDDGIYGNQEILVKIIYGMDFSPLGYAYYFHSGEYEDDWLGPLNIWYAKNAQGDITGLIWEETGEQLIEYEYDAWGAPTVTSHSYDFQTMLAALVMLVTNPLAWRGYEFDFMTGLYYLQSRYYSPSWGRFLNADTAEILTAKQSELFVGNLFAYCGNDPVNFVDPMGL
jgi:RHS repeat-associated protein